MIRFFESEEAQGLVEFALILPPLLLVLVFGVVELGTVLSDAMTMAAATREGACVASALVNGGGALGCSAAWRAARTRSRSCMAFRANGS